MPIYEYECLKCGERFSLLRGFNDKDEDVECPKCKTKKPRRTVSNIASLGGQCGNSGGGNYVRRRG
jgi:putative FmdB family regulatory protein